MQSVLTSLQREVAVEIALQVRYTGQIAEALAKVRSLEEFKSNAEARQAEHEKALRVISAIEAVNPS